LREVRNISGKSKHGDYEKQFFHSLSSC
jgi:hypothetical protein